VSHREVVLRHGPATEPHHPALVVLEVAVQAAVAALYGAHPELDYDEPPPHDEHAPDDVVLAETIVLSCLALLRLLRHYRTVQYRDKPF